MLSFCNAAGGRRRPRHRETRGAQASTGHPELEASAGGGGGGRGQEVEVVHPKGLGEGGCPLSVGVQEEAEPRMEKGLPPVQWRGLSSRAQWPPGGGGGEGVAGSSWARV